MKTIEKILCAAISDPSELDLAKKPLIYCALRHNNLLWQSRTVSRNPKHQGFLTSFGRFVSREEALKIALKSGQVKENETVHANKLFSEDLYSKLK